MKSIIRLADLFLYTSLLTTCCATGLCMATERLINGSVPQLFNHLHILIFGSTLLVYNMPSVVYKPGDRHRVLIYRKWNFFFAITGAIITGMGLWGMPLPVLIACAVLGIFAFAYFLPLIPFANRKHLRDFGWLKIAVLAGVWTFATSVLPILYWHKHIGDYPFEILIRLVFIFTLCIIFDIRDMRVDEKNNISTLPQKVGVQNSYRLIDLMLLLFAILSIVQYMHFPNAERLTGSLLTALITRMVVGYLRKSPSDRGYLALADGVMLIYALLVMVSFR